MCIKEEYNKILESNSRKAINDFIDKYCKNDSPDHCPHICGGCDYLGWLQDKLREIEDKQITEFMHDNLNDCIGICNAWKLEIKSIEDLKQAADYLLNQI